MTVADDRISILLSVLQCITNLPTTKELPVDNGYPNIDFIAPLLRDISATDFKLAAISAIQSMIQEVHFDRR